VTAFVTGIPFILAIIAISKDWSTNCDKPINVHTLIEGKHFFWKFIYNQFFLGICNLLNFLFCIYLCFRYGKKYSVPHEQPEKEEKNILQVTQDLILYDFVVCFYIFFVIFFLVWTIIGSVWLSEIDSNSSCYQNHTFLIRICLYNVIVMWIFLGVGLIVFLFTILVYACEDGSCTFYDMCRCSMLICSCGFCDIGKRVKKTNRAPPKNPPQNNSNWISKSKNFLGKIGILSQYSNRHNQPNYHQPNPESNMVMVQLPNAQYNNPPPPKYINPPQQYNNPPQQYNNPHYNQPQQYNIPQQSYNAPEQQYNVPQQQYNNPYPQLNNNPNQGYNYPKNNEVVNVNAENVSNEKVFFMI